MSHPGQLQAWWLAARPKTLAAGIVPVLVGTAIAQMHDGLHVSADLPTGMLAARAGTLLAAAGSLKIVVHGKGGHAAMPHKAIDPVATAAKIVVELQTIISRELDPLESGVISVTMIHGGGAYNVIPPSMDLQGTIRSLTLEGLKHLQSRVKAVAEGIA